VERVPLAAAAGPSIRSSADLRRKGIARFIVVNAVNLLDDITFLRGGNGSVVAHPAAAPDVDREPPSSDRGVEQRLVARVIDRSAERIVRYGDGWTTCRRARHPEELTDGRAAGR